MNSKTKPSVILIAGIQWNEIMFVTNMKEIHTLILSLSTVKFQIALQFSFCISNHAYLQMSL